MKIFFLFVSVLGISLTSFADDSSFQVLAGDAKTITGDSVQTTDHGLKLEVRKTHTLLEVAPHSQVKLMLGQDPESIELISGMVRSHVEKKIAAKDTKPKFVLKSKAATMGVRGTDFVAVATPVLGESEIIVFEGNVDFTSTADATDVKHVPTGHWGGVGGRFGAKTHELMALPKEALSYFDQVSSVK